MQEYEIGQVVIFGGEPHVYLGGDDTQRESWRPAGEGELEAYMAQQRTQSAPQKVGRKEGPNLGRKLGLGARAVTQGVASLPALAWDAPAFVWNQTAARGNHGEMPYLGPAIREALPFPEPETTGERAASAAIEGGVSAVMPGGILKTAGKTGRAIFKGAERYLGTQAVAGSIAGATGSYVTDTTDNPWLGTAAGLAAGSVPLLARGLLNATRLARRGDGSMLAVAPDKQDAAEAFYDAADRGVDLRVGDVLDNSTVTRRIENSLDNAPGYMRDVRNPRQAEQVGVMLDDLGEKFRPVGLGPSDDVSTWMSRKLREQYQTARREVGEMFTEAETLAADAEIPTGGLADAIIGLREEISGLAAIAPKESALRRTLEKVREGWKPTLTYREYRSIQTQVGRLAARETDTKIKGALNSLYKSISGDMDDWAISAGEAGTAHRRAVDRWRESVVPFTDKDRNTFVRAITTDEMPYRHYDAAADNAVDLASRADRLRVTAPEDVDVLMSLLPEDARNAVPYRAWRAAVEQYDEFGGFTPNAFLKGTTLNPDSNIHTPFRRMVEKMGMMDEVAAARDVVDRSRRAITNANEMERTGRRMLAPTAHLLRSGMGAGVGAALGGTPGAVAGAMLGEAAGQAGRAGISRFIQSPGYAALQFADKAYPFSSLVQAGLLSRR